MLQSTNFFPTAAITWCTGEPFFNVPRYQPQRIDLSDGVSVADHIISKKINIINLAPNEAAKDLVGQAFRFVAYHVALFFTCLVAPAAGLLYYSYATARDLGKLVGATILQNDGPLAPHLERLATSVQYLFVHAVALGIQLFFTIGSFGLINLVAPRYYATGIDHKTFLEAQLRDEFGIVGTNGELLALTDSDLETRDLKGMYSTLVKHYEKKILIEIQKLQIELTSEDIKISLDYPPNRFKLSCANLIMRRIKKFSSPQERYSHYWNKIYTLVTHVEKLRPLFQQLVSRQFDTKETKYTVPEFFYTREAVSSACNLQDIFSVFNRIIPKIKQKRLEANLPVEFLGGLPYDPTFEILYKDFPRDGLSEEYHAFRKRLVKSSAPAYLLDLPPHYKKQDVDARYRKLAVKLHPDKIQGDDGSDLKAEAAFLFKQLTEAKEALLSSSC